MKKNVLIVIDMQNDFAHPEGSFFVQSSDRRGSTRKLIEKVKEGNWDHILATKDFHPPSHASFRHAEGFPNFPPHCVQDQFRQGMLEKVDREAESVEDAEGNKIGKNRGGAKFLPSVLEALNSRKNEVGVEVFFKAFFREFDSFGGDSYSVSYSRRRPLLTIGCESRCERDCLDAFTGSFAFPLTNPGDLDSDPLGYPGIDADATDAEKGWKGGVRPASLSDRITKILTEAGGSANIYVCGLALDFCVKDTAINLWDHFHSPGVDIKILEAESSAAAPDYDAFADREVAHLVDRGHRAEVKHVANIRKGHGSNAQELRVGEGAQPVANREHKFGGAKKSRWSSVTWVAITQGLFVSAACAVFGSIRSS